MTLTYNVTRQQAADYLGVSTRTVDRYVKKGALSYKKIANKVLLSNDELDVLKKDLDLLNQTPVAATRERVIQKTTQESSSSKSTGLKNTSDGDYVGAISEFAAILTQKDQTIEEKNQLIFMLQRKIGEIETQMMNMVALPHHTEAKEELSQQITELEERAETLEAQVRREKMRNTIYVCLVIIAAIIIFLWFYQ